MPEHNYEINTRWTGNLGVGTKRYNLYSRNHLISVKDKPDILCSSDPSFRGDKTRYNPEELLLASLSSCHMLWYLHLSAVNNIVVIDYTDKATSAMQEDADGSGFFTEVKLHPIVIITDASMTGKAKQLHHDANKMCFIANSVKFPVKHEAVIKIAV
ncbi:MAG: OsmC family protein [Parafilimonas sp.]